MKSDEALNRLVELARRENVPAVDVTGQVMSAICSPQTPVNREQVLALRTLAWTAGVATVIAVAVLMYALPLWQTTTDPVTEIMIALQI